MEHVIDATNQPLGRLASHIAVVLQGKNSPKYNPRLPGTERVVVTHVSKILVTGNKYTQKTYYKHTGYMGHLKEKTYKQVFEENPDRVLRDAVYNMLPKNRLRNGRLQRLTIKL
ncbi:MAG: 50S ribosomal protein L13 [Candidatus Harrisonbacteria bacterium CG10_big_fil_rev_8_21_14_0_10_40_38]|uniref:Large ribosomal subunit protein uL13 n=1 Tax=Candidatus Harrisonbacteria bacterium CG10_big_fil_rev_8_21_14_0_10_40_38 TaxID=1974583 RepID=A0A2H0US26_9BACT|nr:MAG: 50S ribosomal protein L13 [Candidatus Harrisonbacteria bacterium CG10_big_fil_rev_8_21_14_0_10_40_38]